MTQAAPANYVWWLAGRSAGFVAMALITCSVILGLAMAARVIPTTRRRDAVRLHQHLALIALGAIAAAYLARAEGIVPAPEANHAVKGAIDEAVKAKEEGRSPTILFNLCGHGHFDMQAYIDYFGGKLADLEPREVLLAKLAGAMKASMSNAAATFNALPTQMALLADALRAKVEAGAPAQAGPESGDTQTETQD